MEEDGLLNREVFAEVPPRVEYSLTETGESLSMVLKPLEKWGKNYQKMKSDNKDTAI